MFKRRRSSGRKRARKVSATPLPPLVLIVEDHNDTRELYADHFKARGFRVESVSDGASAVAVASRIWPDIVVMDLALPLLDGWEATRRLKAMTTGTPVPVIACTGHAFGPEVERALIAGCDAYLVKPCPPEDLEREVWKLLASAEASRRRQA